MSVYFRFKSSKVVESIPIDGPFIPVRYLKDKIIERTKTGKGSDLLLINPKTDEEYVDDETLIHKCSTVLIRRIPRRYLLPIVLAPEEKEEEGSSDQTLKSDENSSTVLYPEDSEWDDFVAKEFNSGSADSESDSKSKSGSGVKNSDEDSNGGSSTAVAAAAAAVQGFNRRGAAPPPGYVCHRCNIPGHFIQHCSTNGDPNFDVKRLKRPIGIPTSMLVLSRDGSYALPTGDSAEMKPNEAVFEKEIEGVPFRNSVDDLPPELNCPLCKKPMKDAVFTSKCCFRSFCDPCIRDHIIKKSMCDCGAKGVLADDLLPNTTLRNTINRMLWSDHSSSSSGRSSSSNKSGLENASRIQPAVQSSNGSSSISRKEETCKVPETVIEKIGSATAAKVVKAANVSETITESVSVNVSLTNEKEIEQNVSPLNDFESVKSKKNNDIKKQKSSAQNCSISNSDEHYMISNGYGPGPYAYNPYWSAYMSPYANNFNPYMGYGVAPMNTPFDAQNYMRLPSRPHHRVAADAAKFKARKPNSYHGGAADAQMFEARRPNMKRKRETERCKGY